MIARVSSAWADSLRRLRERYRALTHSPSSGLVASVSPPATRCTITPLSSGSQLRISSSRAACSVSFSARGKRSTRSSSVSGSSAAKARASTIARNLPSAGVAGSGIGALLREPGRQRLVRQQDQDVLPVVAHVGPHQTEPDDLQEGQERQDA